MEKKKIKKDTISEKRESSLRSPDPTNGFPGSGSVGMTAREESVDPGLQHVPIQSKGFLWSVSLQWRTWWKFLVGLKQFFQIILLFTNLKPNQITKSLADFYSGSATKWESTRKKPWPEFDLIWREIESYIAWLILTPFPSPSERGDAVEWLIFGWQTRSGKKIVIVELGCGDGRFAQYLDERFDGNLIYMWFDCSVGLVGIAQAKEYNNDVQFTVWDMTHYLRFLDQQSVDIIISIASIQHLHRSQRRDLRDQAYRVLQFEGLHISINRSYSKRMLAKHRSSLLSWIALQFLNHRTFGRSDYMISFKEKSKISYRYYHLYLLGSLVNYAHVAWFHVKRAQYVSGEWQLSDSWDTSRNTFIVAQKVITF